MQSEQYGQSDAYSLFVYAIRSQITRDYYLRRLKIFFNYINLLPKGTIEERCNLFAAKAIKDPSWVLNKIITFLQFQKERTEKGEITAATLSNFVKALKLFCEISDVTISWKKISRGLPRPSKSANDRAPTISEIKKVIDYPDRRIKPIIYTMASSGIRIGAWNFLQWKHISPIHNDFGEVTAAKMIVYAGDAEEYFCFITPQAYLAIKEWMDFRASYGEKIDQDSWLMRDIWQTTNVKYGAKWGLAAYPKKLKSSGVKRIIERALWEQGLRQQLRAGEKRHEWKAAHGFRKFYKTRTEQAMKPINVEITMGHDIGLSAYYYKPTEKEILEDYMRAVDTLTITNSSNKLEKQISELNEKNKDSEYFIHQKLQERDNQIETLMKRQERTDSLIQSLIDTGHLKPKTS